jgi:hypothetical protein
MNMTIRFTVLLFTIAFGHEVIAQGENRFKNFHGLVNPQTGDHFFEAEGYDIFLELVDNTLDEKGITKIKKKYNVKEAQLSTDSVTKLKILSGAKQMNGATAYYIFYLIPETAKKTTVVGFRRPDSRDIKLERDFVNSHIANKIPDFVYTKIAIDSIDFVGRTIQLGPICQWMSPHNIQCPDRGQMNWAIFDDLKQAEEYRDRHFATTKEKNLVNLKEEKWINLKFEGKETRALKTKMKIQVPKLVMGGSNVLVVYYVTGEVRGKYVTCILSQYTDDVSGDKLAPLLSEVLELIPE